MPSTQKEHESAAGFGRQRLAERGPAQRLVLGCDRVGGWRVLSGARAQLRSFFSAQRALDRPADARRDRTPAESRSPARAPGSARPASTCFSRNARTSPWSLCGPRGPRFLGPAPRSPPRSKFALGLVVRRPRDAVLLGGLRHRRVLDGDAAQHLVLDLHDVARIEELAFLELRIADLLRGGIQRALFDGGPRPSSACDRPVGPCGSPARRRENRNYNKAAYSRGVNPLPGKIEADSRHISASILTDPSEGMCVSGVISLTVAAASPLHSIRRLPPDQAGHQPGEIDQIAHPEAAHGLRPAPPPGRELRDPSNGAAPDMRTLRRPPARATSPTGCRLADARKRIWRSRDETDAYSNKVCCSVGTGAF